MPRKTSVIDYSYAYINRFPKTEKELRVQLMKKSYNDEDINKAVRYLKTKKLIDDKLFCEIYIEWEIVKRWKPVYTVKQKLLLKWVANNTIDQVIYEKFQDIETWTLIKIQKEIDKLKNRGIEWFIIIDKLIKRWYKLRDIKKTINDNYDNNNNNEW